MSVSEDELLEMDDEAFEQAQMVQDDIVENAEPEPVVEEVAEAATQEVEVEDTVTSEETDTVEEETEVSETEDDSPADTETEPAAAEAESHTEDTEETEAADDADEEAFDYEASFGAVMEPLKVSGKQVQVKSIDDMRNLAMMGIDYSRKMRDIKPLRAVGETLTQAGIIVDGVVNEEALTRLIDINNGDANALAQLASEHNIDPLDMETEDIQYTPTASVVSEDTLALQDVERELTTRGGVENVVTELNRLDDQSKQFFNESPANLLMLDDDIKSGTYAEIMGAVHYEKSLGRLTDMSDMEAYIQLATQDQSKPAGAAPEVVAAPSVSKSNAAKRKAAGITKRAPATKQQKTYDYVNMSDEEFEELIPKTSLY